MTKNTSKLSDQDQKKLVMFRIASSGDEGVRPVDLEIDPPFRMTARDCRITLERLLLDDKIYLNDRFRLVTKGLGSEKAPAHQTRYVAGDYRIYVTRDNDGFYSAIVREFPELQARCFFRTHVSKDMLRVLQSKLDELYKNGEDVPTPVSKRL